MSKSLFLECYEYTCTLCTQVPLYLCIGLMGSYLQYILSFPIKGLHLQNMYSVYSSYYVCTVITVKRLLLYTDRKVRIISLSIYGVAVSNRILLLSHSGACVQDSDTTEPLVLITHLIIVWVLIQEWREEIPSRIPWVSSWVSLAPLFLDVRDWFQLRILDWDKCRFDGTVPRTAMSVHRIFTYVELTEYCTVE
jgi:hypothetical protein